MQVLKTQFDTYEDLVSYVKNLAPWSEGEPSFIRGGRKSAEINLLRINPITYASTRNYGDGDITRLSPYIHHGIISLNEVRNFALTKCSDPSQIIKFIQELGWRDYWQRIISVNPEWAWQDIESYKTGFLVNDYADDLPDDIIKGTTDTSSINAFIKELIETGYIHNHARMYLASYIVHFRRIKWQVGAKWFLKHLLDGDIASNNLSWQWVASTFSNKPYIFNLENVDKYFAKCVDTSPLNNQSINDTYEALTLRLFPKLKEIS